LIRTASALLAASLLLATFSAAHAQSDVPQTKFQRQLSRLDLSANGVGIFNTSVTGPVLPVASNTGLSETQFGSNTFGALVTLRYIARPYLGFEGNYGYARYTENYSGAAISAATGNSLFQVQTKVNEYTFGYVATPPHPIFGFQPFVSAGFGTQEFKPTPRGGEGEPTKARATYYYSLGLQQSYFSEHFGFRAGFRQLLFLDPDFGQNYLTIKKHASTYEPMVGFYLKY
jgi:hypothetical protein